MSDGVVELMVHRRLLHDDAFGVGEALNETEFGEGLIVRGSHYIQINESRIPSSLGGAISCNFACRQRTMAEKILSRPIMSFSNFDNQDPLPAPEEGLTVPLPPNVHLLTLTPLKDAPGKLLLRLEHMYERGESPCMSQPVSISMQYLLKGKEITWARETTLSANRWRDEWERLQWKSEDFSRRVSPRFQNHRKNSYEELLEHEQIDAHDGNLSVTLGPMEIRTFIVEYRDL